MKHHPIQLVKVQIKELQIIVNNPVECEKDNLEAQISYRVGSNQFDSEEKILMAGFKCLINNENDNAPFSLVIELIGVFTVSDEFPEDKIEHFARYNAPIILMPYVRENVYSLAIRAGVDIYLPLVQVPTK
ncbi:hypothetical protein BFR77_00270 [Acinetobacter pittii]|uniref:protein-export chaperone SecB n=1 Tax=Acinetobacter pittii TaxID=48296 RepID=UPI00083991B9|nr:protein-export chaperone SecB [Acinetobacter pittii]OCY47376.1 hypothetical protein BFR77_00270 [Acinetobacter pittii]